MTHERGSVLTAVLLLLLLMSGLAAVLGVSGQTATLAARNHESAAQARAAAEGGLNHATEVTLAYISAWAANGFAGPEAVLDALLVGPDGASGTTETNADNGSLENVTGWGVALGTRQAIAGALNAEYDARVMDEEDPARGTVPAAASIAEDGDPLIDTNKKLLIRATGYGPNDTSVVLEAMIVPLQFPAIVTNGDLTISGNPTIDGTEGSVHSNGDLTITGSSTSISQNASASGTLDCDEPCDEVNGTTTSGAAEIAIPEVRASDHRSKADFVLESNGTMTCGASAGCAGGYAYGATICGAAPCNNWNYDSGNNKWTLSGNTATDGTYYVEGAASISGNPEVAITIIAEGSIEISGNPELTADTVELLFVTDGDLKIGGNVEVPLTAQGLMLVHEQLMISGNPDLVGQLIVENAPSIDDLVTNNTISGNPTITYNGGLGDDNYQVSSWREVR